MSAKPLKVFTFTVAPFDYGAMDAEASDFARQAVTRIKAHERAAAVDIGRELVAVKERLGHGHFLAWIEAEFGWSRRTATNMMQVAQEFGDDWEKIAHLPKSLQYQIASPSAPQAVRDAVHKQASAGFVEPYALKRALLDARKRENKAQRSSLKEAATRQGDQDRQGATRTLGQAQLVDERERSERHVRDVAKRIGALLGSRLPELQKLIAGVNATSLVEALKSLPIDAAP